MAAPVQNTRGSAALLDVSMVRSLMFACGMSVPETAEFISGMLNTEVEPQIAALERLIDNGSPSGWQQHAHRLIGGCTQLGLSGLASAAAPLERTETAAEAAALSAQLRPCLSRTRLALRAWADGGERRTS